MAYIVRLWTPCEDGSKGLEMRRSIACATMTQAWNCAVRLLKPLTKVTTWELRSYGPLPAEATIERNGAKVAELSAEEIVESIADRLRRGETVFV